MKKMTVKIFKPKFTWTRTKIINLSMATILLFECMVTWGIGLNNSTFTSFSLIVAFILLIYGIGLKIYGLSKIEKLKGSLNGNIEFNIEYIKINGTIFDLNIIQKIEISGVDWLGMDLNNQRQGFNYENNLSNGIENFLTIYFCDNSKIRVQFQQQYALEFREIQNIITHYYVNGKIGYLNCVDILGLDKKDDWNAFKKLKI